tara:strand:- start:53 stop:256 length:204 start_codon:yes stop_codon:yes gene_type:complete
MLEIYRANVSERASQGIPPKPRKSKWTEGFVALLKNPPEGAKDLLFDFIASRALPGVNKAAFIERFK